MVVAAGLVKENMGGPRARARAGFSYRVEATILEPAQALSHCHSACCRDHYLLWVRTYATNMRGLAGARVTVRYGVLSLRSG